jgi:hypothetical protein
MFAWICLVVICVAVGFLAWNGRGPDGAPNRRDPLQRHRRVGAAAILVAVGGTAAAVLVAAIHDDHLRALMTLSSVLSVTGGAYGVYCAVKPIRPAPTAIPREQGQRHQAELKREGRFQAIAGFDRPVDSSPMEIRMTGSLRSIREKAEQALVASDADKGTHLRAIWWMAASDLDDDRGQVAH